MKRSITCLTGSRADLHLMVPVFAALAGHPALDPTLVVTGAHLHPDFRATSREAIAGLGLPTREVNMLLADDGGAAMAQSLGLGICGLAQEFANHPPDIVLLQGDRGEMLAGAIAAAHMNLPVVHMSGGDRSGSIDNAIRDAVTAFAHLHLTTCAPSSDRLRAMGEAPSRVLEVGEPALDRILTLTPLSREALCAALDLDPDQPVIAATLHPVTTEADQAGRQMRRFLEALADLGVQTVLTAPNTDAGNRDMRRVIAEYATAPFLRFRESLGFSLYASLLRHAAVLAGNSSSGILEAASFGLPVVNVGSRQQGRLRAGNVLDADHDPRAVGAALRRALTDRDFQAACRACVNPYGDGTAAKKTADILARLRLGPALLAKWLPGPETWLDAAS